MPDLIDDGPLRQALRGGAEVGLARAMANIADENTVGAFIEARLSELAADDLSYIKNLAKQILQAGEYLGDLQADEYPDPSLIPTNSELFADEPSGDRVRWFGEWTIPGSEEWHKFSGTLPDLTTYGEIVGYAAQLASSYIEAYPTKFLGVLEADPGEVTVRIIGTEKAF